MRTKGVKINGVIFTMAFFLAAFFLIMPDGIGYIIPGVLRVYRLFQCVCFLLALFFMMLTWKKSGTIFGFILTYYLYAYGSAYVLHGNTPAIWEPLIVVSLCVLVGFGWKNNRRCFLNGFMLYFELLAYLQILLQILYPQGMFTSEGYHQNWILGYKNLPVRYLLPGACFAVLRYENCSDKRLVSKMRMIAYLAAFTYVVMTSRSATGIIGMVVFLILLAVFWNRNLPKIITIRNVAIISMIVFMLVFFADFQYKFEFLIVGIFGKSLNFTGRINAWMRAFELIEKNWLMGIGFDDGTVRVLGVYNHAHQYWLQILLFTGVIGFILHFCIFAEASRKIGTVKKDRGARVIVITIIAFMIMGIDEALAKSYMLLPLLTIAGEYRKKSTITFRIL